MFLSSLLPLLTGCPDIPTDEPAPDTSADTADSVGLPDVDEDGFANDIDCDDNDATVNPGVAADICNAVDDDCDGAVDEDPDVLWYPDGDGDGYGAIGGAPETACAAPAGYGSGDSDCADDNAQVWPEADERCDELDNDCDGEVDEGLAADLPYWTDEDADGAGDPASLAYGCAIPKVGVFVTNDLDCDDADPATPVWVTHGAGAGTGTHDDPYHKVQDGIRSGEGCVLVGPGTYSEDLTWPDTDPWVRSTDGAATTTVTGSGTLPVVTVSGASSTASVLEGFTISGGGGKQVASSNVAGGTTYYYTKYFGGGVAVSSGSGISLRGCIVTDNKLAEYAETTSGSIKYVTASYGGGVYVQGGTVVLDGVELTENYAYNGGGLYSNSGQVDAVNTRIAGNQAYAWAGLYGDAGSNVVLGWSIVDANRPTSSPGGLAVYDSDLSLDHVDVVSHDYGVLARGSSVTIASSIFAGNAYGVQLSSSKLFASYDSFHNDSGNYSGVTDPTGTDGNIEVDCAFTTFKDDTNADNDVLTLTAASPCVDVGSSREQDVDGSLADLGAYGGPRGDW